MKKIALLISLVLGAACLTGCTNNGDAFTEKSYTAEGKEITGIFIDVRDRQIEVMLSPDNQVHIDYFESSKEYYYISVSDSHTLKMAAASDKEWTDYIGGSIVFERLDAEKSMNLSAKNGDITGSIIGSYDDYAISCESKKGESNLPSSKEGGKKSLTVPNNNGDIDIEFINEFGR